METCHFAQNVEPQNKNVTNFYDAESNSTVRPANPFTSGLQFGTKFGWVVNFTRQPLSPCGKNPQYPLDVEIVAARTLCRVSASAAQPVSSHDTDWAIDTHEWSGFLSIWTHFVPKCASSLNCTGLPTDNKIRSWSKYLISPYTINLAEVL